MIHKIPTYDQMLNSLSIARQYVDRCINNTERAISEQQDAIDYLSQKIEISDTSLNNLIDEIFKNE